ncbi:MAG: hypothetical protein FJ272_05920 [Planctomycetes bacterium]|nr:hypothetical protein [Planctomycetota bacterium]
MSKYARSSYELSPEQRRQLELARIRESARRLHERFSQMYDEWVQQGLDQYLPEEFQRVEEGLDAVAASLEPDPEAARDRCVRLGTEMTRLPALAREAKAEFEARWQERMRRRQTAAPSAFHAFLQEQMAAFSDPVVRDFAHDELRALHQSYEGRAVAATDMDVEKERVRERLATIRAAAQEKAVAWKRRKESEVQPEAQQALLAIHREEIARDVAENPEQLQALLSSVEALQQRLKQAAALDPGELQEKIKETVARCDEAVVDERCRKETVKAVLQSLRKAGFIVGEPRRLRDGDRDEVVVLARKPAGHQAEFRVALDGGFLYKFDRYEGMACKKDMDRILPMLQSIYGVKLSNERVIWQNPIRDSRTARPMNLGTEAHTHGR